MEDTKCLLCESSSKIINEYGFILTQCSNCGKWIVHQDLFRKLKNEQKHRIKCYLRYHKKDVGGYFIGSELEFRDYIACTHGLSGITSHLLLEEVNNWYPVTFENKIDSILLFFAKDNPHLGLPFSIYYGLKDLFFIDSKDHLKEQFQFYFKFLLDEGLIDRFIYVYGTQTKKLEEMEDSDWIWQGYDPSIYIRFTLTPKAWSKIYELQKTQTDNKQVFIAMSFDSTLDPVNDAIKAAIVANGYFPRRMDEYAHNNQIVPEMLFQIRQSKFVIADLTNHNNGAYYEAGYAAALGKPVILTCKKDSFDADSHFDVKQQATIVWENEDELKQRLTSWIEATIGKAE